MLDVPASILANTACEMGGGRNVIVPDAINVLSFCTVALCGLEYKM